MSNEAPKPPKAKDSLNPDNLYADGTPVTAAEDPSAAAPEALVAQPTVKPDNLYADSSPKD
jgi:hypothetical protein